jgi:hypothetical protein
MADEKDARGMLLRRFLDAETRDHSSEDYDVLERAEAFFKKSEEEEQERIADFSEWIQETVRQPSPEIDFEDYRAESSPYTEKPNETEQEALTELTADLDHLFLEAGADTVDTKDQKEKTENAERSL